MDWLQFISSMFGSLVSLAWPAAFVVVFYLIKEKVRELLPHMRLKAGEIEVSFRLDKAEETAAALPPVVGGDGAPPATPEEQDRFDAIARLSPRAAILELRNTLEEIVKKKALPFWSYAGSPPRGATFATSIRVLRRAEVIDAPTSAILDDLRNVGNSVSHTQTELSLDDAQRYRRLAEDVIQRLEAIP